MIGIDQPTPVAGRTPAFEAARASAALCAFEIRP
jgi:hypothetical protein